jgi:nitrogen regulatory protein PII
MRIALDIHGVLDKYPELFSELSKLFMLHKHEIHVITGQEITDKLLKDLEKFGIKYTAIHSITNYNKKKGTKIKYEDPDNPWMAPDTWNSTKAKICKELRIDFIFDDSDVYGKWFKRLHIKTKYIQIKHS